MWRKKYTFAPLYLYFLKENKQHILIVGLVFSMIMWGVSWPSAKVLSRYGGPVEMAWLRFVFTFFGVLGILKAIKVPLLIDKKGFRSLLMASLLMAFYSLLFFSGIKKGLPGKGGVLVTTTSPLVAFLLGSIIARRTWMKKEVLGVCTGLLAGVFLLEVWKNYNHILDSGNLYFLASTVVWGVLSRFTSSSHQYGSPLAFSMWMYLLCILWLGFFADFSSLSHIVQTGDQTFWFNIIFNGVLNTGVATTIFFYATSKLGAEKSSSFIYIVPFAASLASLIFLGEPIEWNTIVGGLLGLSAVWIIHR